MNINKITDEQCKSFSLLVTVGFLLLLLFSFLNSQNINYLVLSFFIIFLNIYFFLPKISMPLCWLWLQLGYLFSKITFIIITFILFYFIFTPLGIIVRTLSKNYLNLNNNELATYWISNLKEDSSMDNQF